MNEMPNIKKVMKKLMGDLKKKSDKKLINGYQKAMKDYEDTQNEQCKIAADIIKKEIDRRGLNIED